MKTLLKKLVVVALSLGAPLAYSQTEQQKKDMKKETDTVALKQLAEILQKKKMSKEELQKKAKELGIPYSGKGANGSYFELQGFESDGRPIYYTTYQTPNTSAPNRELPLQEGGTYSKQDIKTTPKPTIKQEKTCKIKRKKKK